MDMHHIGMMFPMADPLHHRYLKSDKPFHIVMVTIHFFPVKQTIYIHAIQIKMKLIVLFFDDGKGQMHGPHLKGSFVDHFPLVAI